MTPSKRTAGRVLLNVALVLFLAACVFPVLWMISSSLKSADELFSSEIYLIPKRVTLDHYWEVFASYSIGDWFRNSLATTAGISILQIMVSFLAAFALSYYHTRLNAAVMYFLLITMVIPFQAPTTSSSAACAWWIPGGRSSCRTSRTPPRFFSCASTSAAFPGRTMRSP